MDAQWADSPADEGPGGSGPLALGARWARFPLGENGWRWATLGAAALLIGVLSGTLLLLRPGTEPGEYLSPPLIALLLVANLLPAIALMVLMARKLATRRAERRGMGTGQLHTRLVALFSVIAAVPTVLVAIFASLLFQSGLEFWFSDRARGMLENTVEVARSVYAHEVERVGLEATTMSGDLATYLEALPIDSPAFAEGLAMQTYRRNLNEAAVIKVGGDGAIQTLGAVNIYDGMIDPGRIASALAALRADGGGKVVDAQTPDRISVLTPLSFGEATYLYVARWVDPAIEKQINRADNVLVDYRELVAKSRTSQLRFNAALLLCALVIVAVAIGIALAIADRLTRPLGELVDAAGRVGQGDFAARVPAHEGEDDELATLSSAFNRMTGRIEEQTNALRSANAQLETRRAFIEAVLSSVTAGVIALDADGRVLLVNRSAEALLHHADIEGELDGQRMADLSGELDEFMRGQAREAHVTVHVGGPRTLAVKRMRYADGAVLTFDDITDQLSDQRRAAWSDIARRIAHEIKNPLTPIQLAAERLQRRYGKEITSDAETFERLTGTIVRQVGDLRRMVDEFSNFARMPKPAFRPEDLHDIARAALFLHEVAHPGIGFHLDPPSGRFEMVCDRRQLAQALTNIVKNAVEAIEARRNRGETHPEGDRIDLRLSRDDHQLTIDLTDTGIGLPEERERLTEPYMTTRVRGTGLGLAIVKKIVDEHGGDIGFLDREGGGTHVRVAFDTDRLANLAQGGEGPAAASRVVAEDGEYDEEQA